MPNDTIHDEIESWLAADVHGQLSSEERTAFQQHLAACASCHVLQQEEKQMHQLLENTLATESADPAFEQRMVSRFRAGGPAPGRGLSTFFAGLMRMRAAQITAVAALLLTLVQVGKMITSEQAILPGGRQPVALAPALRDKEAGNIGQTFAVRSNLATAEEGAPQAKEDEASNATATGAATEPKESLDNKTGSVTSFARQETDRLDSPVAPGADKIESPAVPAPVAPTDSRKLIRNAQLDLQVVNYEVALQRLTTFASEDRGFVATQSSSKLPNGKLQGTVVVKVVPENLDRFLQKARSLGELKNQTLGTEDVTKAYFDTDARLRNAKRMEERLLQMLDKNTGKVSDLLQVEKELARVREQIEQMQGELKYYDVLVQYATVTISLAEKDLDEPAAFLLRETANLSLFSTDVEKTFSEVKNALQNAKAQIVQSTLDRDNSGQATARITLLIAPEESEALIARIKGMGRVQNFNVQTERVAQNGSGMSETAKVERDKVRLNLVI
jgi:hypothetical protein